MSSSPTLEETYSVPSADPLDAISNPRAAIPWLKGQSTIYIPPPSTFMFNLMSTAVMAATTTIGRLFLNFHNVEFHNIETYKKLVTERSPDRPLITVSNHQATLDDPLLFSALTSQVGIRQSKNQRWTIGASELCFGNMMVGIYCRLCKVLPVIRGIGIWQPMMDDAVAVLSRPGFDNWVHVFPEGRVHQVHVLPIFIEGTKRILDEKRKTRWLPSSWGGERIAIRVGEPIDFSDLVNQAKEEALADAAVDRVKTYKRITELIQEKVEELRVQTELPASL